MDKDQLRRITELPDHVLPTKELMIKYYLEFQNDTGAQGKATFANGIYDVIRLFQMAKGYYKKVFNTSGKATGKMLKTENANLERFED